MRRQTRSCTVAPAPAENGNTVTLTPSKVVRFVIKNLDTMVSNTAQPSDDNKASSTNTRSLRPRLKSAPPEEAQAPLTPAPSPQRKKLTPKKPVAKPESTAVKRSNAAKKAEVKRLTASQDLAMLIEARRNALKNQQAEQDVEKTALEPNLNDEKEVRWFEVDEQGSLTLVVLDLGKDVEVWKMNEVSWDEKDGKEGLQVVCGRRYKVTRV